MSVGISDSKSNAEAKAPAAALVFGLGGLLPFLGLTTFVLLGPPAARHDVMLALVHYGAIIVSFVGALHWGYSVRDDASGVRAWLGYGWSVIPALVAWLALQFDAGIALRILASALIVCVLVDRSVARELRLPNWLISLRYRLTAVGAVCLLLASFA